ncbi:MAG TPA: gliding motility-associated peptidyl-prolyl isomerase GldI [Flavobacteriaceae bacterium]|nr:gliding motility-associated peptidyl-prolyl isomerase GldI [Flavobacteriaceae bacterium]
MKYSIFILLILILSCTKPQVRKPIIHNSSVSVYEESIQLNKKILKQEETIFKNIIKKDSLHVYKSSPYGFWYYYNKQIKNKKLKKVVSGNSVIINYEIRDTDNNIILSQEKLGSKGQNKGDRLLKIDGEDFILGLHEGIKLMNQGEIVTFLLPSNKAFGATGLQNVIAPNQALIIKVKLKQILNNNNKIK